MIWIVLPAYNEEQALPKLLPKLDAALAARGQAYRMVVVNDGSADRTPEILAQFAARLPLDVVTHPINRGLGETERDGFEFVAARCDDGDVIVRVEGGCGREAASWTLDDEQPLMRPESLEVLSEV